MVAGPYTPIPKVKELKKFCVPIAKGAAEPEFMLTAPESVGVILLV